MRRKFPIPRIVKSSLTNRFATINKLFLHELKIHQSLKSKNIGLHQN